jgi:hypothetical protein
MDGSQVNGVYYKEKNLMKIQEYCVRDVVVLSQLFLKMKCLPLVETNHIITA